MTRFRAELIVRVRTENLQCELPRENLAKAAKERYQHVKTGKARLKLIRPSDRTFWIKPENRILSMVVALRWLKIAETILFCDQKNYIKEDKNYNREERKNSNRMTNSCGLRSQFLSSTSFSAVALFPSRLKFKRDV